MKPSIWSLDEQHSSIVFRIKHMIISTVTGQFKLFHVNVLNESEDFEKATIDSSISVDSVTTNDDYRDDHLKSAALFDVAHFPYIHFKSTHLEKEQGNLYLLSGELTIKDETRSIQIPVSYLGKNTVQEIERAAFECDFSIFRDQFNLTYNPLLENGGMVLAKEVKVSAYITLIKK